MLTNERADGRPHVRNPDYLPTYPLDEYYILSLL